MIILSSSDRLIFIMGISLLVRERLSIETALRAQKTKIDKCSKNPHNRITKKQHEILIICQNSE